MTPELWSALAGILAVAGMLGAAVWRGVLVPIKAELARHRDSIKDLCQENATLRTDAAVVRAEFEAKLNNGLAGAIRENGASIKALAGKFDTFTEKVWERLSK